MEQYIIQIVTAAIGSCGFAILFNSDRTLLKLICFGGGISWFAYLCIFVPTDNAILALFGATMIVAIMAEISARIVLAPVITLLVPMLIPLIPGGDLYRCMSFLVRGDMEAFTDMSQFAIKEACAIAFGILIVTLVVQIIMKTIRYMKVLRPIERNKKGL